MEQVGDKPEDVRKHLEEEQARPGQKQPPRHEEGQGGQTEDAAAEDGTEPPGQTGDRA
ncbi:hypothetical protein ACIF8T_31500 [Streptomyces sp. NPDC085946]|uniref:hypothetical protein n=1 Tax=Streptomyces sp. NPDC085946 TaxID=3365744 RepID=UPI0037D8C6E7